LNRFNPNYILPERICILALFERNKNIKANLADKGLLEIEVSMLDNVHQITTRYLVSFPDKIIHKANASFQRAPYLKVCSHASQRMCNLENIQINKGFSETVIKSLGGKNGCYHLVDQALEMAKCLYQFIDREYDIPFSKYIDNAPLFREKVLAVYPGIQGMCLSYNTENNHLFTKDVKCGLMEDLVI
jgi:hypothetical protein